MQATVVAHGTARSACSSALMTSACSGARACVDRGPSCTSPAQHLPSAGHACMHPSPTLFLAATMTAAKCSQALPAMGKMIMARNEVLTPVCCRAGTKEFSRAGTQCNHPLLRDERRRESRWAPTFVGCNSTRHCLFSHVRLPVSIGQEHPSPWRCRELAIPYHCTPSFPPVPLCKETPYLRGLLDGSGQELRVHCHQH